MEVTGLGLESELQFPAYATAAATWDLSHTCHLCQSLQQHQILNPLSKARIKLSSSLCWVLNPWATMGTLLFFKALFCLFFPLESMKAYSGGEGQGRLEAQLLLSNACSHPPIREALSTSTSTASNLHSPCLPLRHLERTQVPTCEETTASSFWYWRYYECHIP